MRLRLFPILIVLTVLAGVPQATGAVVPNSSLITIGDCCEPRSASPSSLAVLVSDMGTITKVTAAVTLTHGALADVDLLLVSPAGQKVILLSDTGLSASGASVTFDDDAPGSVPQFSPLTAGAYTPTDRAEDCTGMPASDGFPGAPAGATGSTLASFNGTYPNGIWSLYAVDDCEVDSGVLPAGFTLTIEDGGSASSFFGGGMASLDGCCSATAAGTYPSTITVAGQTGAVQGVSATLKGLTHTYAADLNVIVEGPGGQAVMLMSDAGRAASGADLTFVDSAGAVPAASALTSGSYSPTNLGEECATGGAADTFPGAAPSSPGAALSIFNGTNPNGSWKLWVVDDCGFDAGQITNGWELDIASAPTAATLLRLDAARDSRGVTVRWRTAQEGKLLGFNIFREQGRKLVKSNRTLVAASGRAAGASYRFVDAAAPVRRALVYRLQAVGLDGRRFWLAKTPVPKGAGGPLPQRPLSAAGTSAELESLCALEKNGSLRRVSNTGDCRKKEDPVSVSAGPTHTCYQADGSTRAVAGAACPGSGTYLALPPQGADAHFCGDVEGRLRKVSAPGECTGGETPHVSTATSHAPTDIGLASTSIQENAGTNAVVGNLSTSDPDAGNTHVYTLVPGAGDADNAAFNVSGAQLRATNTFDFEQKSTYLIRLRSTDQGGLFFEEPFTIDVTNVTGTSITAIHSHVPDPSGPGQPVTVSVEVQSSPPGGVTPSGSVLVSDGAGAECTVALVSGTGSCGLVPRTAPTSQLTATYGGDANYEPDSETTTHELGLTFGASTSDTELRGGGGGTLFEDGCPPRQAVIGFDGFLTGSSDASGTHGRIRATCGAVTLNGTGSAGNPYTVRLTPASTLPMRGSSGSHAWTRTCPVHYVVVGFEGRTGLVVDQLTFRCAPLIVNQTTYAVATGTVTALAPVGGSGGSAFPVTFCPPNQLARRVRVRAGTGIDAFGLGCGQLVSQF